ncbi:hypothetical protein O3P69_015608 [Scylla paramamosain]|uniref:Lethal giant larvae homologue 2 domain-containing protein n=1 Tax=Scylla paramamosain TaxID=85552 RepID=A0AAW0SIC5_SCYPA
MEWTGLSSFIIVVQGRSATVLEVEHTVLDFATLSERSPYVVVVLLHSDLVVVDLLSPGNPCCENLCSMDVHESSVTCCTYLADCPTGLTPVLCSLGARGRGGDVTGSKDSLTRSGQSLWGDDLDSSIQDHLPLDDLDWMSLGNGGM